MEKILLKEESFKIIGICMEIHRELGKGFKEIVYKDALEIEFSKHNIPFRREEKFEIAYKGTILRHKYFADFVIDNKIILEVKTSSFIVEGFVSQTINYLKASKLQLGIIANFGKGSFEFQRVVFG